jgi:hypothetical protein
VVIPNICTCAVLEKDPSNSQGSIAQRPKQWGQLSGVEIRICGAQAKLCEGGCSGAIYGKWKVDVVTDPIMYFLSAFDGQVRFLAAKKGIATYRRLYEK